jgi:dihydropteroate synthase
MSSKAKNDHGGAGGREDSATRCGLVCRGRRVEFPRRPLVMGILNINGDSFSGDGTLDQAEALDLAMSMIAQGADIIDVGGESARTNRGPITEAEEVERLLPFIEAFSAKMADGGGQRWDAEQLDPPLLSINTWRPAVVEAVLSTGAVDLINDIGGLPVDVNPRLCARHGAALLIMHSVGQPKVPQLGQAYRDVWEAVLVFFREKINLAMAAGLAADAILLDPGIDFAKQRDDNLTLFRHLERLAAFGRPVLLPVSRKTVIGEVLGIEDPVSRDAGTIACIAAGMRRGVQIFRVHNVKAASRAIKVTHRILEAGSH